MLGDAPSVQGRVGKVTGAKKLTLPPGLSLCSVWPLNSRRASVYALSQKELLIMRKVMEILIRCVCECVKGSVRVMDVSGALRERVVTDQGGVFLPCGGGHMRVTQGESSLSHLKSFISTPHSPSELSE